MTAARWRMVSLALVLLVLGVSLPWAFGYLLPQRGTLAIGLAGLAGYSPYAVFTTAVVAWALRRWAALAVVTLLLLAQVVTVGPAYIGDGRPPAHSAVLRLMTTNLYFGTADVAQVVALVRDRQVDVLAVEELSPGAVDGLERAGLRSELPYVINRSALGAEGTGLWSRLPFTEVPAAPAGFNACAADVTVDLVRIRVRAFHPVTPVPNAARWRRSFAVMRAEAADDDGTPTLLLGDFNATVHHRELRRLMGRRWRDAAEADGAGLVRTWTPRSRAPALLDLDHVLIDRGMTVGTFETVPIGGSDHHAVIVAIALPAPT